MSNFLRIALLSLFASTGVGLAISFAISSTPQQASQDGQGNADVHSATARPSVAAAAPLQNDSDIAAVNATDPTAGALPAARLLPPPSLSATHPSTQLHSAARRLPVPGAPGIMSGDVYDSHGVNDAIQLVAANVDPDMASNVDRLEHAIQRVEQITREGRDVFRNAFAPKVPLSADSNSTDPALLPPNVPVQNPAPLHAPGAVAAEPDRARGLAEVHRDEGDDGLSINIQDADIRRVLDLLSQHGGLNMLASRNVQGTVSASLSNVNIDTALEAILRSTGFVARRDGNFVFVGTTDDFKSMDQRLDKIGTRIYRPNFVRASELQSLILPMLSPEFGTISVSSAAGEGIAANSNEAGGDNYAGSEVLLVRDFEAVLAQIDQIVQDVDMPPLQVAIEAMILSVSLDDRNEFGVSFELLRDQSDVRIVSGTPLDSLADISVSDGGLKVGFLDSSTSVFLKALENIGDTNVVASPRLMCLNKQRAEILIGSQLGYVSTTVTENAATQAVEFLEVGTQLRLRPYISSDGMIRMEVHPELSTGSVRIEGGFTLPDKEVTQVTTNIMCRDGSTVVIGGLIREDLARSSTQIPLLGSLPIVGPAFRQKTENTKRREIIVLITPHIVFDSEMAYHGKQSVMEFSERRKAYLDQMSPLGIRNLSRQHFEKAQVACENGDIHAARKHINLAIHLDPLNQDAINFRNQRIACQTGYAQPIDRLTTEGSPLGLDDQFAPWLVEELIATPDYPTAAPFSAPPSPTHGPQLSPPQQP